MNGALWRLEGLEGSEQGGGEVNSDTGLDRGEDFTFYSESGGSHWRVLSRRGDVS